MQRIDWNSGWQFGAVGGSAQAVVSLPHDAMLAEPRSEDSAGGINTGWFAGQDYLYAKTLTLPEDWRQKTWLLEFEGVYHNAEVRINGRLAGGRPYGYSGFTVQADDFLHDGANTVEVLAHNADQPNSRWYSGAGLYRPVWLWVGDKAAHLPPDALRIRTLSLEPPTVEVTVNKTGEGVAELAIFDAASGKNSAPIARATVEGGSHVFTLPGARPWQPETPQLYTCRAAFAGDTAESTFGIRTLGWGADSGFTLNGERLVLRGACIHHDNGPLGAACYPDAVERKVRLLQQAGYNAVRSAHNPCSRALLDACDRLGMLVMDEFVDCWYIHKTKHDYVSYFEDWWQRDLADMVAKDYNHPCVIMYSTGNEVSETAQPKGIALTGQMTAYLHSFDATRPVTCGINIFFNLLSSVGFGVYSDDNAEKQADSKKAKSVGSQFFNDLAGLLGANFMKLGATLHGCDVKTRDAFANMDIAGYNYGIGRYRHDLKKYPGRLILGSETFCSDAYKFWEQAKQNKRLIGDFVWAGMDYLGEVGVGSWEYKDYAPSFDHGPGWLTAGSGRLDLTGYPLAEADYTRVAFELESRPVLAVRPVNHKGERHSPSAWKMTDALRSWDWPGCEGEPATVEVYTRAARAELYLNGQQIGAKQRKNDCRIIFKTTYAPGELKVITYTADGTKQGEAALHTADKQAVLQAVPECAETEKGRLCYIRLQYTDANGTEKPLTRGRIKVEVTGGRLLALGHACPYNADGFLGSETDTYWGRALAIVQAAGDAPVVLRASDGTRAAKAEIPCKHTSQEGGITHAEN